MSTNEVCVRVAIRVRPLLPREVLHNHQVCVRVGPISRVTVGKDRSFSFDHAFDSATSQDDVYETCVQPLVESLIEGYNATVLAYGQTGSGKTYTLGGGHVDQDWGIIGRVAQDVFLLLEAKRQGSGCVEATVRVSYIELYREELWDLLEFHTNHKEMHIREDDRGNTVVVGARVVVVTSPEELLGVLEAGNALRHIGATGMNERSSRSHAILTLQLTRHHGSDASPPVCYSKLHLVDLAGSERAGKTGNTRTQLKESAYINTGLLALGNVIRALTDPGRARRGNNDSGTGAHVPYRGSKITRLLRDSLGGSAHTLMVACVSPSHHSLAETLGVLQFAHRTRHVRNRPGSLPSHAETKPCPSGWVPGEARLGELTSEVQMLREALKEKEREKEKIGRMEQGSSKRHSDPERRVKQDDTQYLFLVQEAAVLLEDLSTPSCSLRQRVKDWQERLVAVSHLHPTNKKHTADADDDEPQHPTLLQLRQELNKCQEALATAKQEVEKKEEAFRQTQKEIQEVLLERNSQLQALEEERGRTRIQTEQLIEQQILIKRLRDDLLTSRPGTSDTSVEAEARGGSAWRPHSVPLVGHSCGHQPARKIHTSPPAYSLERVMAAFKMRGHLLLAEIEEKEEVYCPFTKPSEESSDADRENNREVLDEGDQSEMLFRRSLNRTWTNQQMKAAHKQNGIELQQQPQEEVFLLQQSGPTESKEIHAKALSVKKASLRINSIQRRIRELSINMRMKEELFKELDKTGRDARAMDQRSGDGGEVGVLTRLSLQSQQARAELYQSLQHLRLQQAQLHSSLKQEGRESSANKDLHQHQALRIEEVSVHKLSEDTKEKERAGSWLDAEEEQALRRRVELHEMEAELKRKEEMLRRREACLQQRSKLETKKLRSSQVLNQDLLCVSARLESLEEQLEGSSQAGQNGMVTTEELEKERDLLRQRRNLLNAQITNGKVLTAQEEHSLLELEEYIEALETALEFKNEAIQDGQKQLSITLSHHSQSTEPAHVSDVTRKLKKLSQTEASDLLFKYFNKVLRQREEERRLRLYSQDLQLRVVELEGQLRNMEAALQSLVLDADRRLTLQQQEHQTSLQLLLRHLKEGNSGEAEQIPHTRIQQLEKELFFYKSSSRQLKKKLKELLCDSLQPQPSHTHSQADPQGPHPQRNTGASYRQTHAEAIEATAPHAETPALLHNGQTFTEREDCQTKERRVLEAHAEQLATGKHQNLGFSSSTFNLHTEKRAMTLARNPMHTHSQSQGRNGPGEGHVGEGPEMTRICLSRQKLREIPPVDLHVSRSATRRRHSVMTTSTESMQKDSIEISKKH